jgi:hypothetical protein
MSNRKIRYYNDNWEIAGQEVDDSNWENIEAPESINWKDVNYEGIIIEIVDFIWFLVKCTFKAALILLSLMLLPFQIGNMRRW